MYQPLFNYWQFLKQPKLLRFSKDKFQLRKDFITLLILDVVLGFVIVATLSILLHYKLIKAYPLIDLKEKYGLLLTGFLMCIAAPLIEEGIFRYQLRKRTLSIYFLAIALGAILSSNTANEYIKFVILLAFLILAISAQVYFGSLSKVKSHLLWQKLYGWFFYLTAGVFAYVHLSNVKGLTVADPSFVLYILAQFFVGLSLGYLRIKYGLVYAILFHAAYNGSLFLMMAISEI
jgi:hypothetical protein